MTKNSYLFFRLSLLLLIVLFSLIGCDKNDKSLLDVNTDDNDTTSVSPAESFALNLVDDILNEEDEYLTEYLENEIYPIISKSEKVTIDKISSTLYILSYQDGDKEKNLLIEKFYNPIKDEISFTRREIDLNSYKIFLNLEK